MGGPLFNKTSRPRDDDETVESLWSDWDIPRRMMQVALWIKEKNEETGEWESTFWKMLEESKCDDWSFQGHTIWACERSCNRAGEFPVPLHLGTMGSAALRAYLPACVRRSVGALLPVHLNAASPLMCWVHNS